MLNNVQAGIFNKEEEDILAKTRKVRMEIIDDMTDSGTAVPHKINDIRVLNETLDAMDKQVMDKVKITSKQDDDNNDGRVANMVVDILSRVNTSSSKIVTNREINIPIEYIPKDIVPGETEIDSGELSLSDFISNEED